MIKEFWVKHRVRIVHEMGLWLTLVYSFVIGDGAHLLLKIYAGEYIEALPSAIFFLITTSAVKAALVKFAPSLFPLYQKGEGIIPTGSAIQTKPVEVPVKSDN